MNNELPIYCGGKDERFEGVALLDSRGEEKLTAEGHSQWWTLREWEIEEHVGIKYWVNVFSYTVSKQSVRKLYEVGE